MISLLDWLIGVGLRLIVLALISMPFVFAGRMIIDSWREQRSPIQTPVDEEIDELL